MTYGQLIVILEMTQLSPEQLGPTLGVSNMTLRRWIALPQDQRSQDVPSGHEQSIVEGVYQLITQGHLNMESAQVQSLLKNHSSSSFRAILSQLGVTDDLLQNNSHQSDEHQGKMSGVLFQIGQNTKHRKKVDNNLKQISTYQKLGKEWKSTITTLLSVLKSNKLTTLEKWVAYGALFYLLMPLDLIPDHIPMVGLLDDFGILSFATAYYFNRYPKIIKRT